MYVGYILKSALIIIYIYIYIYIYIEWTMNREQKKRASCYW